LLEVDDPDDPRLADFHGVRLRDDRHFPFFIAEGRAAVAELLASPYPIRAVLLLDRKAEKVAPLLNGIDVPVYVAPESVLRATLGFNLHRGVVASADRIALPTVEEVIRDARFVAVLERLNDHENLGSLFRNARALGVDAVLLDPETADPLYRRCVRVSMGHVLRIPIARFTQWPDGLDSLRRAGFTMLALTPSPDALTIDEIVPAGRIALLLGSEGTGLSDAALHAADTHVRIPMANAVDSLNVATAAAIAFQRLRVRDR
jgi:tRNA G18 (ribose-2'-O)-methylase SpoU